MRAARPPRTPDQSVFRGACNSVEKGSRPALAVLFESYGITFNPSTRPYLQYPALEQAALEKDPDIDLANLQEQFRKTFQQDSNYAWRARELKRSTIYEYFARCEGNIPSFRYDPEKELRMNSPDCVWRLDGLRNSRQIGTLIIQKSP